MATDVEDEERTLGSWPRRLLHVPTLTSFVWQPGNVYNEQRAPRYNAITYTWGRWRLNENDQPHVRAIPISINGDTWPIPRVDPKHFTVDEFTDIIRAAAALPANRRDPDPVDFIWLDIACIHQEGDPRSAAEIGRQAAIFHGAKEVFIWLTTHRHRTLERIIDDIWWINGSPISEHTPLHWRAMKNWFLLLTDPWFSSLWTLQEAFLRHDGYLLSRDAKLVKKLAMTEPPVRLFTCTLYDLLEPSAMWTRTKERVISRRTEIVHRNYEAITALIQNKGLIALYERQEINMYIAAQSRMASREEDRIYGIQQIFGLRLGNTAPAASSQMFGLQELETNLAERLLIQYPIQSQMHVFSSRIPAHLRWRVHSCSQILGGDSFSTPRLLEQGFDHRSILSVRCSFPIESSSAPRTISWNGFVVPFQKLKEEWDRI